MAGKTTGIYALAPACQAHDPQRTTGIRALTAPFRAINHRSSSPSVTSRLSRKNHYPYFKEPCHIAGLLEQWIETTFQVVSILMGYAFFTDETYLQVGTPHQFAKHAFLLVK